MASHRRVLGAGWEADESGAYERSGAVESETRRRLDAEESGARDCGGKDGSRGCRYPYSASRTLEVRAPSMVRLAGAFLPRDGAFVFVRQGERRIAFSPTVGDWCDGIR